MTSFTPSTSRATFAIGSEQAARRVVDRLNESFFEGQAAIAAFERSDGRWDITMHFADAPDQAQIRDNTGRALGLKEGTFRAVTAKAFENSYQLFAEYIEWRADHPSDDLMTQLLNAEIEEDGVLRSLTRTEVLTYTSMIAGAGN